MRAADLDSVERLNNGDLVVAGYTGGAFPGYVNAGGVDGYIRRMTTSGSEVWTVQFGTPGFDDPYGLAVGPSDRIAVVGRQTGGGPGYLRVFSSTGVEELYISLGPGQGDGVAFDSSGNILVAGRSAYQAGYVNKYAPDGTQLWDQTFSGNPSDVIADATGNIFVAVEGKVIAFDSSGNQVWSTPSFANWVISLATDGSAIFATGGIISLNGANWDGFVQRIESNGSLGWFERINVTLNTYVQETIMRGITHDSVLGKVVACGDLVWSGQGRRPSIVSFDGASGGQRSLEHLVTTANTSANGCAWSGSSVFVAGVAFQAITTMVGIQDTFVVQMTPEETIYALVDQDGRTVTVSFAEVSGGTGGVTLQTSTQGPPPPAGFKVAGVYYYLETDLTFGSPVDICINYLDGDFRSAGQEVQARLRHWDTTLDPDDWLDITTSLDTVNNEICGVSLTGLSPFIITEEEPAVAPVVEAVSAPLAPQEVGTSILVDASFTDENASDTHTAEWSWGDSTTSAGTVTEGNGSGTVTGSHAYSTPGVYTLSVVVTDSTGLSGSASFHYVVVYDPDGGFVTGGGLINSPAGAYLVDPSLVGKANFGFNSKYKKGTNVPTGQTEFVFKVADLNFHSSDYEWLVVAGAKAKYKGIGNINGTGNYGFMLSAVDGSVSGGGGEDKFRIKIWDKDNADMVVYDNELGASDDSDATTVIGAGNIVIHE